MSFVASRPRTRLLLVAFRLRVVFGVHEKVALHGHVGVVAEEDGLAVGFVVGAGEESGADGGVDDVVFDAGVLDADEAHAGVAANVAVRTALRSQFQGASNYVSTAPHSVAGWRFSGVT